MTFNTCRLCKDFDVSRPVFRYGIRHYAHAECGLEKWGSDFLRKLPKYQVGLIPFRALASYPAAQDLALEMAQDRSEAKV